MWQWLDLCPPRPRLLDMGSRGGTYQACAPSEQASHELRDPLWPPGWTWHLWSMVLPRPYVGKRLGSPSPVPPYGVPLNGDQHVEERLPNEPTMT